MSIAALYALLHTVAAALAGAGAFYVANKLKLKAIFTDVIEIKSDFDHTPHLAEVAKDVKKLLDDVATLQAAK